MGLHGDTYTKLNKEERKIFHKSGDTRQGILDLNKVNPELARGLFRDHKMFCYLTDGYSKKTALVAMMYDEVNRLSEMVGSEDKYDEEDYHELWLSSR